MTVRPRPRAPDVVEIGMFPDSCLMPQFRCGSSRPSSKIPPAQGNAKENLGVTSAWSRLFSPAAIRTAIGVLSPFPITAGRYESLRQENGLISIPATLEAPRLGAADTSACTTALAGNFNPNPRRAAFS